MTKQRFAVAFVLALGFATPAFASDLEGTYEGKFTCTSIDAATGEKSKSTQQSTLEISQVASQGNAVRLNVSIDGVAYSARAFDHNGLNSGKGFGDFVLCGTNDDSWTGRAEIEHFTYKVNPSNGKGSIKKKGIFNLTGDVPSGGEIGSCTGSWKRVSPEDPEVESCVPF